jgi:hypothetical protein
MTSDDELQTFTSNYAYEEACVSNALLVFGHCMVLYISIFCFDNLPGSRVLVTSKQFLFISRTMLSTV